MRITAVILLCFSFSASAQEPQEVSIESEAIGNEAVVPEENSYRAMVDLFGEWQIVTYARVGQNAVLGGDMVLGTHEDVQRQSIAKLLSLLNEADEEVLEREDLRNLLIQAGEILDASPDVKAAVQVGTKRWTSRQVPYLISASIGANLRQKIMTAIEDWNSNSVIQLVPSSGVGNEVLRFEDAAGSGWLCQARLGRLPGYGNLIELNPPCTVGSVRHEIGHALGLMHEHSRPDRDRYLAVEDFAKTGANYGKVRDIGASTQYDVCSLMHYGPDQRPAGRPQWFELTSEGQASLAQCAQSLPAGCRRVGQRCALSAGDKAMIEHLYADQ